MKLSRVLAGLLALVLVLGLSASAVAKRKPKAPVPAAGMWTMSGDPQQLSGSFTVAANHRSVSGLQIAVGPEAATVCGTGTITIAGPAPMHVLKGGPGNKPEYVVGKGDHIVPQSAYIQKPLSVSVSVNGASFPGQLLIAFRKARAGTDAGIAIVTFTNPAFPADYGPCQFDNTVTPG